MSLGQTSRTELSDMIVVVEVEHNRIRASCMRNRNEEQSISGLEVAQNEMSLNRSDGRDLFLQIENLVKRVVQQSQVGADLSQEAMSRIAVRVVLPGSIRHGRLLERSERLGIQSPCDLDRHLQGRATNWRLTNDVYASAMGTLNESASSGSLHLSTDGGDRIENWKDKLISFVFADEGVGSLILYKGEVIKGAGYAGPLGHCVVEPTGQYFDSYRARGALEAYSSRPWLSTNIICSYLSHRGKDNPGLSEEASPFQRALASYGAKVDQDESPPNLRDFGTALGYQQISNGINEGDPLALHALHEAADYFGRVLSYVIVALNPHAIVLDGGMIHRTSRFFQESCESARKYTWQDGWHNTEVLKSGSDDNLKQVKGVLYAEREGLSFTAAEDQRLG